MTGPNEEARERGLTIDCCVRSVYSAVAAVGLVIGWDEDGDPIVKWDDGSHAACLASEVRLRGER